MKASHQMYVSEPTAFYGIPSEEIIRVLGHDKWMEILKLGFDLDMAHSLVMTMIEAFKKFPQNRDDFFESFQDASHDTSSQSTVIRHKMYDIFLEYQRAIVFMRESE